MPIVITETLNGVSRDATSDYLTPEQILAEFGKEKMTGIEAFNLLSEDEQREIMFFLGIFDKEDIPDNWDEILNRGGFEEDEDFILEQDSL